MVRRDRGMGCNERNTKYLETRVFEYLMIFQTTLHSASKSNLKKKSLRHALGGCKEIQM
jgi:hypothetical protein